MQTEIWFECCGQERGGTVTPGVQFSFTCLECGKERTGLVPRDGWLITSFYHPSFVCWITAFAAELPDGNRYEWTYESEDEPDEQARKWYGQDFGIRIDRTKRNLDQVNDPT